jgi:hypothetical protein
MLTFQAQLSRLALNARRVAIGYSSGSSPHSFFFLVPVNPLQAPRSEIMIRIVGDCKRVEDISSALQVSVCTVEGSAVALDAMGLPGRCGAR